MSDDSIFARRSPEDISARDRSGEYGEVGTCRTPDRRSVRSSNCPVMRERRRHKAGPDGDSFLSNELDWAGFGVY